MIQKKHVETHNSVKMKKDYTNDNNWNFPRWTNRTDHKNFLWWKIVAGPSLLG